MHYSPGVGGARDALGGLGIENRRVQQRPDQRLIG